jgi:hypothetical protein
MQEALGFLSGDGRMDREDLVPLAEGASLEQLAIEHRNGDEAVSPSTARSPLL